MIRVASLLRRTAFPGMEAVRGPKKKKGEVETKIQSTDIVNIFKDRADPQPRPIQEYPIYVQEISRGAYSVHEYYYGIQTNNPHRMPGRANLNGYLKAWKRQKTKAMNQYKHLDRNPNIMSDNDIIHRRMVYDLTRLGDSEEAERKKLEEAEAAAEDDDDDE